jgi:exodeoxyribonuclease VII large subunit
MSSEEKVYSVAEITRLIKSSLEGRFSDVWIEGEISNLKRPQSGHVYLTIKDERAQILGVVFRQHGGSNISGLQDGDKIRAFGTVSIYEKSGQYQLYIKDIEKLGVGDLYLRFNKLKEKLQSEGLFDKEQKKAIPLLPQRIGVITSPTGAAIRDILNVLERRFSNVHVIIFPVKVQGEGSAEEIADAVDIMNQMKEADVLIVGRGGGSLEDLWAFNEEIVARAIYRSEIPVISAVGHEVDYTISDFVADMRAETPTAAAELVLKKKQDFMDILSLLEQKIEYSLKTVVREYSGRVRGLADHYVFKAPINIMTQARQRVDDLDWKLSNRIKEQVVHLGIVLIKEKEKISALSPQGILKRGFSIAYDFDTKTIVKDVKSLKKGKRLKTVFCNGHAISLIEDTGEKDEI